MELGVERYRSIQSFGNAAISVQAGNKVRSSLHVHMLAIPDAHNLLRC
jgi:hypothetical protein